LDPFRSRWRPRVAAKNVAGPISLSAAPACKKYCWTHSAHFALGGAPVPAARNVAVPISPSVAGQRCCKNTVGPIPRQPGSASPRAFLASGGWFSNHWPTTNRYQARDHAHEMRENDFPKRRWLPCAPARFSGPQFYEEPSSRSLTLSPAGTGVQPPLDFTSRSTLVTRKMFTDLSGFRSTTRGVLRLGKCSLAYLCSLSAVGASSAQRCSWIYRERPMRERSVTFGAPPGGG
jgi:hypothetical protein